MLFRSRPILPAKSVSSIGRIDDFNYGEVLPVNSFTGQHRFMPDERRDPPHSSFPQETLAITQILAIPV